MKITNICKLLCSLVLSCLLFSGTAQATTLSSILVPDHGALFGAWTKPHPNSGRTFLQELAWSENEIGRQLDIWHLYYHISHTLPTTDMTTAAQSGHIILMAFDPDPINSTPTWQEIYQGQQDATLTQRANELKTFPYKVMINFDHEADANVGTNGTSADYVKAYQHVWNLFHNDGVTNVVWVWDMRGSLFTSTSAANALYPGNSYVDWIAADAYNWYPGQAGSTWRSFQKAYQPFENWAQANHPLKPQMAEETASQENPSDPNAKAAWITAMGTTIQSWTQMKAVVWFNSDVKYPWWWDTSTASLNAYTNLGHSCFFDVILNPNCV